MTNETRDNIIVGLGLSIFVLSVSLFSACYKLQNNCGLLEKVTEDSIVETADLNPPEKKDEENTLDFIIITIDMSTDKVNNITRSDILLQISSPQSYKGRFLYSKDSRKWFWMDTKQVVQKNFIRDINDKLNDYFPMSFVSLNPPAKRAKEGDISEEAQNYYEKYGWSHNWFYEADYIGESNTIVWIENPDGTISLTQEKYKKGS